MNIKIISNENNIYPLDNDSESLNESNDSNNDRLYKSNNIDSIKEIVDHRKELSEEFKQHEEK